MIKMFGDAWVFAIDHPGNAPVTYIFDYTDSPVSRHYSPRPNQIIGLQSQDGATTTVLDVSGTRVTAKFETALSSETYPIVYVGFTAIWNLSS
jgi:hypothetical protein